MLRPSRFASLILAVTLLPAARTAVQGASAQAAASAQPPVEYRLTFPDYVRHVMDVDVVFSGVTADPLDIHMSRSSPGRYALAEFAKNVFDVRVSDGAGKPLAVTRPSQHVWQVKGHGGTVHVRYRVFGDRIDGTYFGVDAGQAHVNVPATLMWAATLETRPATLTFVPPADAGWVVATQLYPTPDPLVFTAPNLAYLMDSPVQLGPQTIRTVQIATSPAAGAPTATLRLALRQEGGAAVADHFLASIERVVREARAVYGELPAFEPGYYTFLASYGPGVSGDGMEHRNSTSITSSSTLPGSEDSLLGTVAHEFFHAWNVERIRPRSLEPFDFTDANMSSELWVAEGFTQYYGPLLMTRSGLSTQDEAVRTIGYLINAVEAAPGRRLRPAPEMSRLAVFTDAACSVDPTNWDNTFLSYYTFGAAIGLELDLSLRDRSNGAIGLDDFMRALWTKYGKSPGPPGIVTTPYTAADLEATLGEISGSAAFAREFFERDVNGTELVDFAPLLARMGLIWRPLYPGRAWMGDLPMGNAANGVRITGAPPMGQPAWDAGFGEGDVLVTLGGTAVHGPGEVAKIVDAAKPGDRLEATYLRNGKTHTATIALRPHPTGTLVTVESTGQAATPEQLRMRAGWLGPHAK